jgi:hypothetical protein
MGFEKAEEMTIKQMTAEAAAFGVYYHDCSGLPAQNETFYILLPKLIDSV